MSLEKREIEKIAHLARLAIDESAIPGYAEDLTGILDLVDQMSAVDTEGVEPLAHPHDAVQRLREDVVTEENQRERLQSNAPQTDSGLFLVPKVIE
ncbi:MAG: Asp-tRNA(Asn)/Glu-tRNA(Gln) amidotransferase subunit GatC [Gammaproteobacteria bacterium]|nr:Asp-tRNA(Asn)/Glu-tRNA(Gln) amidotransferase subunit GatC [Gammaproteobacteria bacterium]MBT7307049.1 Asp-tRNA(Asn)/Glu-tRNA(Gln) amidotransferase subunit GatC [Gammaproteobacteria bacterium]